MAREIFEAPTYSPAAGAGEVGPQLPTPVTIKPLFKHCTDGAFQPVSTGQSLEQGQTPQPPTSQPQQG